MSEKNLSRLRRARKARARIQRQGVARLTVHRTGRHLYAQVIAPGGGRTVARGTGRRRAPRDSAYSRLNSEMTLWRRRSIGGGSAGVRRVRRSSRLLFRAMLSGADCRGRG